MRISSVRKWLIALALALPAPLCVAPLCPAQTAIRLGPSAAQTHGQSDDITVLTLAFAPAEVLHA
jgi:hypothetical protein